MINVDELSDMIKNSLNGIQNIKVCGEIGKIVKSSKQHLYFDLKSQTAIVSCVAWSSSGLQFQSGQAEVMVRKMDFYSPYGKCQAVVSHVEQLKDEKALIATQRADLINRLHSEGIIHRAKNTIPDIIEHLVIITSHNSAAHYDMKQGVNARWPGLNTTVIHTSVQGPDSLLEIPSAFRKAITLNPDVIICGRGGGSEADLEVFNDEKVIRYFIHNKIPIIAAIGHESDHSIADLVADVRAKTPTAAVEIAIKYTRQELTENLDFKYKELLKTFKEYLHSSCVKNDHSRTCLYDAFDMNMKCIGTSTQTKEVVLKQSVDKILGKCALCIQEKYMIYKSEVSTILRHENHAVESRLDSLNHVADTCLMKSEHLYTLASKDLEAYSPHIPLKRGFAFVTKNGNAVKSSDEVQENDELCVKFMDGNIDVIVKKCRKK